MINLAESAAIDTLETEETRSCLRKTVIIKEWDLIRERLRQINWRQSEVATERNKYGFGSLASELPTLAVKEDGMDSRTRGRMLIVPFNSFPFKYVQCNFLSVPIR